MKVSIRNTGSIDAVCSFSRGTVLFEASAHQTHISNGECGVPDYDGRGHSRKQGHDFSLNRASRQISRIFLRSATVTVGALHILLCALLLLVMGVHGEAFGVMQNTNQNNISKLKPMDNKTIRHLQKSRTTANYGDKVIEVLDMGVDYPSPLLDDVQTNAVHCNGVTFTVKNLSQEIEDEPMNMNVLGLEVYMSMRNNNDGDGTNTSTHVTLEVYARPGENNTNPLQDVSTAWVVLEELGDIALDSDVNGEFVSILLKKPYVIPANSAVTLFVFVEQSASIVTRHETDAIANQIDNGRASMQSGTAVRHVRGRDDQWTPLPNSAFLGNVLYEFPNAPPSSMDKGVESSQDGYDLFTMNMMSLWAPGDVPARTYGIAFDVYSYTGCKITSLDIHTPLTTHMVVEVYTRQESSFQDINIIDDKEWWHLTSKTGVKGQGQISATRIPPELFETVVVKPNSTLAFYITTTQVEVASISTLKKIGNVVDGATLTPPKNPTQDTSLDIRVGQTVTKYPVLSNDAYPMGLASPHVLGQNVIFSGKIHYEERIPALVEAEAMDLNPELISQLKLTIEGISRRTLRRLREGDGTMGNDGIRRYFEGAGQSFIHMLVNKPDHPYIDVRRFVVSPDIDESDVTGPARTRARALIKKMLRGRDLQKAKLEVYVTILGEHSPLPVVDFSALTQDSFNNEGGVFLDDLKKDPPPEVGAVFDDATNIRAHAVIFPQPPNLFEGPPLIGETDETPPLERSQPDAPEEELKEQKAFLLYVYVASGCAMVLLAGMVATYCCTRQKEVQKNKRLKKRIDNSTIGHDIAVVKNSEHQLQNNPFGDSTENHTGVYPLGRQLDAVGPSSGGKRLRHGSSGYAGLDQDLDVQGVTPPAYGRYATSSGGIRSSGADNKTKSPSQRFRSTSGRHMLSTSGRRIWDAVTGSPKQPFQEEAQ
jgi:hypothetical protein